MRTLQEVPQTDRSVYDCLYVALAVREGCTLITADRRLAAVLAPATGHVVPLDRFAAANESTAKA